MSSLSGRVQGHALEADGRPGLALCLLLCETSHLPPVSGVRGVQSELGFILVPSLLFCCFLGNFSTAEAEQNSTWILWVSERAAFPLACHWCHRDPLYCSRASELWSVTAAATGSAVAAHTLNRTSRGDSKCGKGFFA